MHLDVEDFFATGEFGPLRPGASVDELRALLPAAPNDSLDPLVEIWAYGSLELHFLEGRLHLIWCDFLPGLTYPTEGLTVAPWIVCGRRPRTLKAMLGEFTARRWPFRLEPASHRHAVGVRLTASGVDLHFEEPDDADATTDPHWPAFRLVAFGLSTKDD